MWRSEDPALQPIRRQRALCPRHVAPRGTTTGETLSKFRLTNRLSVRTKVLGIVAAGIVVSLTIGLLALSSAARLRATTAEMAREQTSVSASLAALKDSVWAMRNAVSVIGIYVGGD